MSKTKGQQYLDTLRSADNPLAKWSRQRKLANQETGRVHSEAFCLRFSEPKGHWRAFCDAWECAQAEKRDEKEQKLLPRHRNRWLLSIVSPAIDAALSGNSDGVVDVRRFDILIHRGLHSDFLLRMPAATNEKLSALATKLSVSKNTLLLQILLAKFEQILSKHGKSITPLTDAELQEFKSQKASKAPKSGASPGVEPADHSNPIDSPSMATSAPSPAQQDQDMRAKILSVAEERARMEVRVALLREELALKKLQDEEKSLVAQLGRAG